MQNQNELWVDVLGYEGFYQISNLGRLKSLSRKVRNGKNGYCTKSEKIISLRLDSKGYYHHELSKFGVKKDHRIHRLVAIAFIPNPENKPFINHKDGIKTNNSIDNLEWCTHSENTIHAYSIGIMKGIKGAEHSRSKRVLQYTYDGQTFIKEFGGVRDAGRITGINQTAIGKCAQGLRKSAGGYVWKYE